MTVSAARHPTLLDLAKRQDPDGKIAKIIELLMETNEILDDMVWMEANQPTYHRTTVRSGLPAPTWRALYQGVTPTKSQTYQVDEKMGMLEAYAEVDKALADLAGNTNEFRLSEDTAHIEGMSQELANTLIYGNAANIPQSFTGFAPRFNDLSANNAENIINGGGTGSDNRSIWLVVWGDKSCHGIYPKGSEQGLQMNDKGQVTIEDADGSGGRMEAYRTHYRQDAGVTVRDWRYVVRIANIDFSALTADASSGANLPNLMFEAMEIPPNLNSGRAAFYMDRKVRTKVRQQLASATSSSTLQFQDVGGRRTQFFQEIPMRRVDALSVDEAQVT